MYFKYPIYISMKTFILYENGKSLFIIYMIPDAIAFLKASYNSNIKQKVPIKMYIFITITCLKHIITFNNN